MRSLVDTEGLVEIASSRGDRGEDRKVDLIVREMRRYNVKVTALQETQWFGSEVYRVVGNVVLTSGRKKPVQGDTVKRGEGVAILLRDQGRHGTPEQSQRVYCWVGDLGISCTQCLAMLQLELLAGKKETFFDELNSIISSVPAGEIVLDDLMHMLGLGR